MIESLLTSSKVKVLKMSKFKINYYYLEFNVSKFLIVKKKKEAKVELLEWLQNLWVAVRWRGI